MDRPRALLAVFELDPVLPRESLPLALSPGWNLVSTPLHLTDTRAGVALGERVLGPVWAWAGDRYEPAANLVPRSGCWVYIDGVSLLDSVTLVGVRATERVLRLGPGWNLTGPTVNASCPAPGEVDGTVWQWPRGDGAPGYDAAPRLEVTRGYWVHAQGESEVVLQPRGRE
jgi:hypothetical protein